MRDMKKYWDEAHLHQDIPCLTNTSWERTRELLELPKNPEGKRFLCIGIGTGEWIRELYTLGANIDVLDVTEYAFTRIYKVSVKKFLASNLIEIPNEEYDYAASLWVAPHMTDIELYDQLIAVIRGLKKDGVFALHYNEPLDWINGDPIQNREEDKPAAARMFRTRETMERMVQKAGGKILKTVHTDFSPKWYLKIICVHIGRA